MNSTTFKNQFASYFKGYTWLYHLLFWVVISIILFYTLISSANALKYPLERSILAGSTRLLTVFLLSYTFSFFVMPVYHQTKFAFWWKTVFLMIIGYAIQIAGLQVVNLYYPISGQAVDMSIWGMTQRYLFTYIALFGTFIAFCYFLDIYERQRQIQLLSQFKTEKIALESSFLKSQVNPHFLFNTLNNIYALSLKKSDQTPVIIDRLESLLHYMLYECKADTVLLADEFTFTNSYIALEKLRHREDQCVVNVNITGEVNQQYIAPLLLINFIENAFKHGTKTSFGKSWINMAVSVNAESMHFNLQNSKPLHISNNQPISEYKGGIGLKNVKRRLEILYPGQHELEVKNMKDRFEVDLMIDF